MCVLVLSVVVDDYVVYFGGVVWMMDWFVCVKMVDVCEGEGGGWLAAAARGAGYYVYVVCDVGVC